MHVVFNFHHDSGSPGSTLVKNLPAKAGDARDVGSVSGSGRSPGEGNGSPLQYSCLQNCMDRGAWRVIVREVTKSRTWLSDWHFHNISLNACFESRVPEIKLQVLSLTFIIVCHFGQLFKFGTLVSSSVLLLSRIWLLVTPWTVARQASLSMGFLQARILKWVSMLSSRGSSQPRNWTCVSFIGRWILYHWTTTEALPPQQDRVNNSTHLFRVRKVSMKYHCVKHKNTIPYICILSGQAGCDWHVSVGCFEIQACTTSLVWMYLTVSFSILLLLVTFAASRFSWSHTVLYVSLWAHMQIFFWDGSLKLELLATRLCTFYFVKICQTALLKCSTSSCFFQNYMRLFPDTAANNGDYQSF